MRFQYRLAHRPEQITVTSMVRRDGNLGDFIPTSIFFSIVIDIINNFVLRGVCAVVVVLYMLM